MELLIINPYDILQLILWPLTCWMAYKYGVKQGHQQMIDELDAQGLLKEEAYEESE